MALCSNTHTHMCIHTHISLFSSYVLLLIHIFSLMSTHLTRRRKSPVAFSFWLWFRFCVLMPSPAVRLCVPRELRHSCCSDLITSGSNWWFCPHAPEPQDPTGVLTKASFPRTFSTPPRHPLNTNSTRENPNMLCVLLKSVPIVSLKWKPLSVDTARWKSESKGPVHMLAMYLYVDLMIPSQASL